MNKGLIPMPFFEGKYTARFEYLAEFAKKHKGKMIFWFDDSDMFKAKEMFGDYVCIRGNVPGSLLVTGTPKEVEEHCKKLIEGCMEGGGYLMDGGISGIPDEANFYFVHSYYADLEDTSLVAGTTEYNMTFCSILIKGNLVATQFHPEKSGEYGLRMYANFLNMAGVKE